MALEGTLYDMSLVDLFEIFRMGNKSGVLRVWSLALHSSIYVTMGRLIDAEVRDLSTRQVVAKGDDAILQVLQWDAAEFAFTHDSSTVRHPVAIFYEIEQLVQLSAELPKPTLQAGSPPLMAMPILANLAFAHDLDSPDHHTDHQISRHYRRLCQFSTAYDPHPMDQPPAAQVRRLDLVPVAGEGQSAAPEEMPSFTPPVLRERAAGQVCDVQQVTVAVTPPRAVVSPAGRKVLAAVLRRVRAL